MAEKISVIIPVWKPNIKQLQQCIQSIIKQTYQNLEILIIYRNSKEHDSDFYELVKNFNDERIVIMQEKIKGFVNALNLGIKKSTGQLIARIDADDFCDKERFEKQIKFRNKFNLDIVSCWAYQINEDGERISEIQVPVTHKEIREKMMMHSPMLHSFILTDKKFFEDVGLYDTDFIHAEDYELFLRAMSKNKKFGNVPEYLGYAREAIRSRSRGEEWRIQRKYAVKAKTKAVKEYSFTKPMDLFYYSLNPVVYFMSPKIWRIARKYVAWNK